MLRLAGAGLVALGLHAGLVCGAYQVAKRIDHERPLVLKRFLVDKQLMREILERIKELEKDDLVAVEVEELDDKVAELEAKVEEIPEPDTESTAETALDTAFPDTVYVAMKTASPAKGEAGEMGEPDAQESSHRYGVKGPQDNPDPHLAKQAALRDQAEFGLIGLLNSGAGGDPDAPTAPWGRDDSLGSDPVSARGKLWGDSIGESFGRGGLGLSGIGTGRGGGGTGEGIGLGKIGTIGHGAGTGTGQGFGTGHGRLGRSHRPERAEDGGAKPKPQKKAARKARVQVQSLSVSDGLQEAAVKRMLRAKRTAFRSCYDRARASDPSLSGSIQLRFGVDASGSVVIGKPEDAVVSTFSDEVASCVLAVLGGVTFPKPKSDSAQVSFRLDLRAD